MFGPIGIQELTIILLVILLLFGGRQIPRLAGTLGRSMSEFSRGRREAATPDSANPIPEDTAR